MARRVRIHRRAALPRPFSRILVGVDGSLTSTKAARKAIQLAKSWGAALFVASVAPAQPVMVSPIATAGPAPSITPLPMSALANLEETSKETSAGWVDDVVTLAERRHLKTIGEVLQGEGTIAETLEAFAEHKKVDLIIVGTRSSGSLKRLILGSVSSALVNNSSVAVLVVR